jgi:cell division protease FtsH
MAEALIKYETLDKEQIEDLMHKRLVREPANWNKTSPPINPEAPPETPKSLVGGPAAGETQ